MRQAAELPMEVRLFMESGERVGNITGGTQILECRNLAEFMDQVVKEGGLAVDWFIQTSNARVFLVAYDTRDRVTEGMAMELSAPPASNIFLFVEITDKQLLDLRREAKEYLQN